MPDDDISPDALRCRVGDAALIVKGPWAGIVVAVVGYELVDPFHWVVRSEGSRFTFEGGFPDSVWARAIDDFLLPLRPEPEEDVAALFALSGSGAAGAHREPTGGLKP
jgi:hypothetical protein